MREHHVYRCFDNGGRLIYVGCTVNVAQRMYGHDLMTWWSDQVAEVTSQPWPSFHTGRQAERVAIQTENPRWNVQHRWAARESWTEDDFKDFVYAALRSEKATLKTPRIVRTYKEYVRRFGARLADPRIDEGDWTAGAQYLARIGRTG